MLFQKLRSTGVLSFAVFFCFLSRAFGQDTSFVQRHAFESPVRNVFKAGLDIYAKTGTGLYRLQDGKWEKDSRTFLKPYVFFENDFFEADFLPNKYIFDARTMEELIPQYSLSSATVATNSNGFFLAVGGSLYEYSVNKDYVHRYNKMSIRDVYHDKGLRVVSTYSGIIINDSILASQPGYSNGPLCKVKDRYYLCSDQLFELLPPDSFKLVETGENAFAGYSRKVIEYKGRMFSLNTKSVNRFDDSMVMQPIHQGYEYYDMEVVQGKLIFSTQSGEVFQYDGTKTTLLCQLKTRIRDIYTDLDLVYLSSDDGVFTIRQLQPATLTLLAKTPHTVMVLIDRFRNTWISTENGLYVRPDKSSELIPYIPDVEFNRGALSYYRDSIYAGSIEGLYVIDTYHAMKNFIPLQMSRLNTQKNKTQTTLLIAFIALTSLSLAGWLFYSKYRKRQAILEIPHRQAAPQLTLDSLEQIIRKHQIVSVEGLAEHLKTSTVQLNREFKVFDTTPGKFLKKVKLQYAKELLAANTPMEEIVRATGYSASFLVKELRSE